MNVRREVLRGFLLLAVLLLIGGLLVSPAWTPPILADVPAQPETRTFTTWTTIGDGLTAYTYITDTIRGGLVTRVTNFKYIDFVIASTVASGSGNKLAATAEFSNDLTTFATATRYADDGDTITYTVNVTPTSGLLRVPVMGEFVRLKLAATGANTVVSVKGRLVPEGYAE